jgi:peptidyl-prolyl cis-trans isomerase SurA
MITDFSEAAFSLSDTGTYTKPFKTPYGWHIIKLIDKKPVGSYKEMKPFLESKMNQSYLNAVSKRSLIERLKVDYKLKIDPVAYNWFLRNTDTLIMQGLKKYSRDSIPEVDLYTFANQKFSASEFAAYIEKRGSMAGAADSVIFIDKSLETRITDHIFDYENSVLEKKYPDFRYLMNEFHDGILLFEITGKKVWNKVKEDEEGLNKYYQEHKSEHLGPPAIEAKLYKVTDGVQSKFIDAYRKISAKGDPDPYLVKKFNRKNKKVFSIEEGSWKKGENEVLDRIEWKTGTIYGTGKEMPAVTVIRRIIDPVPVPLDEVRDEMMTGFQEQLETQWLSMLKKKYAVKVNAGVLEEVKKKLKNE